VTAVQLLNPRPSLRIRIEAKPLECQYIIFQRFSDSVTAWFIARMLVVLPVTGKAHQDYGQKEEEDSY
jgi:hypothetical protein